ncbi:MAG: HAMP domain-containing histidine kinase [Planctomycetes bacterium]|nr:HAMP domain-containing histidine kinase [Planctomycetota bacterium]
MRSRLALVAAFLLPTLLVAWLGLSALRSETERGTARYREQAEVTLAARLERLRSELAAVSRGAGDALSLAFDADGTWRGETLRRLPEAKRDETAAADEPASDPGLQRSLEAEIDRLEASGELERALDRLRTAAESGRAPELVAWALETRALLSAKLGRSDDASAARRELVERCPDARTAAGLRRSFVARRELARAATDGTSALADLYADASADHAALEQTATAEFVRSVRTELAEQLAREPDAALAARIAVSDRDDAYRARLRRWLATLPLGASDWIASGASGGVRLFELADEPIASANPLVVPTPGERVLVSVTRDGAGWRGGALELSRLFTRTLEDDAASASSFRTTIEPLTRPPDDAPIARQRLAAPLDAFEARVGGGDFASFVAGERRKLVWTASLVALVFVLALGAALATLRAVAREVEASKAREGFVAAVTHELKAPLAAIRLFAEMLERGDVEPEKVKEFGGRTVRESDRLARLVDGVLDLARLEHGASKARTEPLELRELVERAVATVAPLARERGFEIVFAAHAPGGTRTPGAAGASGASGDTSVSSESRGSRESRGSLSATGDRDALHGALVNLLDNALKYSDTPHTIEIELRRTADRAEILVKDRGRGVPDAERARIFEPFRRVGDELTRDRPGVGLGLALVKKIALAHAGDVRCEGREGGGSVFVLSLPLHA